MRVRLPIPFGTPVKRFVPRSLLGRTLLIMLVPLVLVQAVALQMFYGSHLEVVSRRLSGAIAGEIAYTVDLLRQFHSPADREWVLQMAREQFTLEIRLEPGAVLEPHKRVNILGPMDDDLAAALTEKFNVPFTMDWTSDPHTVLIRLQLPDGVLDVQAPRKRLAIGTLFLFFGWLVGSALLLFAIAALFMRNQVRAIRRLARSAEAFGMGRDVPAIRPEGRDRGAPGRRRIQPHAGAYPPLPGATDRDAGRRVARPAHAADPAAPGLGDAAAYRGVAPGRRRDDRRRGGNGAHDRRLPRLRPRRGDRAGGTGQSVGDPGGRRGRGAAGGDGAGSDVPADLTLKLRADAVRRAITNLVDNARRHARHVALAAVAQGRSVLVTVDDDGPGIPAERRESVFRPFESGSSGGTGLGLTIARDIVRAHGGEIVLEDSPLGGLRARIRLPV